MNELHRAADKLVRELDILEGMSGPITTREQIELLLEQGKRVRRASTVLVRVAAQRRDELQTSGGHKP